MIEWRIVDLHPDNQKAIEEIAGLLLEEFQEHWPDAWETIEAAHQEVRESLGEARISRIAIDRQGSVLGWIGGISQYDGNIWELHPLVVRSRYQNRGIGRALVADLEQQVKAKGGLTLWVGTDDEDSMTTLVGVDLYPNVLERISNIKNLRRHPYKFYQKLGFVIVGLMPDANGLGK
jgi:aminoglycoside 6'-N-acetyltransferase I